MFQLHASRRATKRKTTKKAAKKKTAKRKVASKRELIDTGTRKLFVRRNARAAKKKVLGATAAPTPLQVGSFKANLAM
jgi:hypothetical protein